MICSDFILTHFLFFLEFPPFLLQSPHMVKILNPDALVPTADTIKNDIMESFKEERKKRKILFQVSSVFI